MGPFRPSRRLLALVFSGMTLCALPALGGEAVPPGAEAADTADEVRPAETADEVRTDAIRTDAVRVVRGRVRLVGNRPFAELLIAGEDGIDWYVERGEGEFLEDYQHRIVTVRGKVRVQELILANGVSLGSRWVLRDISLVAP